MKKLLLAVLAAILVLTPLSAATDLFTFGFEGGWSSAMEGPMMGFHTFGHFGASIDSSSTAGIGTLVDVDLGLRRAIVGDYDAVMAFAFGPSFTFDVSQYCTLNFMVGPEFDVLKYRYKDDSDLAIGIGGTFGATFVPVEERKSRVQLGFTTGIIFSATTNFTSDTPGFLSAKAFFGMTTISPYAGMEYFDIYDDILYEIYSSY
ncbi:MAG: hypothetical protein ACI4S4_02790 [Candidatus Ornithospirochaeta sp.]